MRALLALVPVAFFLAACGGTSAGGKALQTIQISEKEYSLSPSTLTVPKPGTYAFQVKNDGSIAHAFTVEASGGGNEVESGSISPGSSKTIKVTLEAGKRYEMYCPVDGHKQQGMAGTISVGGAAGGGTTTNPQGETTTSAQPGY